MKLEFRSRGCTTVKYGSGVRPRAYVLFYARLDSRLFERVVQDVKW